MGPEFWLTTLIAALTPGTGVLFTLRASLSGGLPRGLIAAAGCTLGLAPHLLLALSGVAALLQAVPVLLEVLRWAGVAYLLWMAWGSWREGAAIRAAGAVPEVSAPEREDAGATVLAAVLVNLLNPKLTVFFLVLLPLFADTGREGALHRMALMGLGMMGITLAVFAGYAAAAAWLRRTVLTRPGVLAGTHQVIGVAFLVLAGTLALTRLG